MNNLWSCCGLLDAKIRASDKDLPVAETARAKQILTQIDLALIPFIWSYLSLSALILVLSYFEIGAKCDMKIFDRKYAILSKILLYFLRRTGIIEKK